MEPEKRTFPKIVCICGSTKFKEGFLEANAKLTMASIIVVTVGQFGHSDGVEHSRKQKAKLDVLHLHKIDVADEILVVNEDGYIGESTEREIAYAESLGMKVRYMYQSSDGKYVKKPDMFLYITQ